MGYQFVAESSCSEWGCDASVVSEVDSDASGVSWGDADAEWDYERSGFLEQNDVLALIDSRRASDLCNCRVLLWDRLLGFIELTACVP